MPKMLSLGWWRRWLAAVVAGWLFCAVAQADQVGLVTIKPTILYDSPSLSADKKLILSGGYPLRQLVMLAGWRKVETHLNDHGWVLESDIKTTEAVVVVSDLAGVFADPSPAASPIFYAHQGLVLQVLQPAVAGYVQVLHQQGGESGYIAVSDVWLNQ